jgi:hypothetical protein
VERYERSFLSMYNNFLRDDAEFERVAAASTLIHATDPAVVSKVLSYFTSLYSATASEVSYLYGPSYEGALDFFQTTDPCLFTTCTNQYWSHKSASSTGVWFNTAAPPCCGECTVYADGVQLFYWPTPNPTPSVTAYQLGSSNATL